MCGGWGGGGGGKRYAKRGQDFRTFQHQGLDFKVRGLGLGFSVMHINDAGTFGKRPARLLIEIK